MLALDDVTYIHPGHAPYSFSLHAAPGSITAITGPSGSGKSTLLDLIAGFVRPASGTITLDERDLLPLTPEQRPVSILFQSDSLFEHLSPAENVALGLPRDTPRHERSQRITSALSEVSLADIGARPAATLSGGQKQRVALARTLLRDRPVLLLDEPFSALDADARDDARQLVRRLTEQKGWITLLVTHDPADVTAIATQHLALRDGSLMMAG